MAKIAGEVFPEKVYRSEPNGTVRRHRIPQERWKLLGQGDLLVVELEVLDLDPNTDVELRVFTSSMGEESPVEVGRQVKLTQGASTGLLVVVVNSVTRVEIETEDRLLSNVELVLDIKASSGSVQVSARVRAWVTAFLS